MQAIPQTLNHLTRPGIAAIYKKRDFTAKDNSRHILVIETNFSGLGDDAKKFESYMTDLLLELPEIKKEVENYAGNIDRIDIRSY